MELPKELLEQVEEDVKKFHAHKPQCARCNMLRLTERGVPCKCPPEKSMSEKRIGRLTEAVFAHWRGVDYVRWKPKRYGDAKADYVCPEGHVEVKGLTYTQAETFWCPKGAGVNDPPEFDILVLIDNRKLEPIGWATAADIQQNEKVFSRDRREFKWKLKLSQRRPMATYPRGIK